MVVSEGDTALTADVASQVCALYWHLSCLWLYFPLRLLVRASASRPRSTKNVLFNGLAGSELVSGHNSLYAGGKTRSAHEWSVCVPQASTQLLHPDIKRRIVSNNDLFREYGE